MILENKLNLTHQVELAKAEEKMSKQKAKQLFDSGDISKVAVGTFSGLCFIHGYLFEDIYYFAGKMREVNIAKGNFRFAPLMYLTQSLEHIDAMPQSNFDEIIEKYVEMNIAHPFREGNGRATRIWLDLLLKSTIRQVVDWNLVDKEEYLSSMQRSVIKDIEIKVLLKSALTDKIEDRTIFMKGIDVSYYYEGYSEFKTEELQADSRGSHFYFCIPEDLAPILERIQINSTTWCHKVQSLGDVFARFMGRAYQLEERRAALKKLRLYGLKSAKQAFAIRV